jgi:hypothetical protein
MIRENDQYTIASLAQAVGRAIGAVRSDLEYLQALGIVELGWSDRLPQSRDWLRGWDDGSIYYYSETQPDIEIRVQDDADLYALLLEFCRRRFGQEPAPAPKPNRKQRQKELLLWLLEQIKVYETLMQVETDTGTMAITFEPRGYPGDRLELLPLLDLLRQPGIVDVEVRFTRGVTHDVKTGSRQSWATVRAEVRWRTCGQRFKPLWTAVLRAWPVVYIEWAHPSLHQQALRILGDEEKLKTWLQAPASVFGGRVPLDIIDEGHAQAVLDVLLGNPDTTKR